MAVLFDNGQLKQSGIFKEGEKHGLWEYFLADGKNALSILFEKGKELKVVEYDKFGKPRNEEDLLELNRIMSGQVLGEETKAEKKARKKKEKAEKKAAKKREKVAKKKAKADKKVLDSEENKE